jgi:hypothetical protein
MVRLVSFRRGVDGISIANLGHYEIENSKEPASPRQDVIVKALSDNPAGLTVRELEAIFTKAGRWQKLSRIQHSLEQLRHRGAIEVIRGSGNIRHFRPSIGLLPRNAALYRLQQ